MLRVTLRRYLYRSEVPIYFSEIYIDLKKCMHFGTWNYGKCGRFVPSGPVRRPEKINKCLRQNCVRQHRLSAVCFTFGKGKKPWPHRFQLSPDGDHRVTRSVAGRTGSPPANPCSVAEPETKTEFKSSAAGRYERKTVRRGNGEKYVHVGAGPRGLYRT